MSDLKYISIPHSMDDCNIRIQKSHFLFDLRSPGGPLPNVLQHFGYFQGKFPYAVHHLREYRHAADLTFLQFDSRESIEIHVV